MVTSSWKEAWRSNRKKILFRLLSDQVSLLPAAQQGELSSIESLLQFCEPSIIINLDIWNSSFFSEVLSCLTISQDGPRPKHNRRNSGTRCFFKQFCIKVLKDGDRKEVYNCTGYESVRDKFEENFRTGRETRWTIVVCFIISDFQRPALRLCRWGKSCWSVGLDQGQRVYRGLYH